MKVSPTRVPGCGVTVLVVLAPVVGIYLFSLAVGVAMERWAQGAGLDSGPRVSSSRLAAGLACIILPGGLGAYLATLHVLLLALVVPVAVGGLVAGILIIKRGKAPPGRPPREHAGPPHAGPAYFWYCWVPLRVHDFGRAMIAALISPVGAVVMLALGNWVGVAVFTAFTVFAWALMLKVEPRSTPRRGPCLRAE